MTERRRPHRRGRGPRSSGRTPADSTGEPNPYRDGGPEAPIDGGDTIDTTPPPMTFVATEDATAAAPPPPAPPAPTAEPPGETREPEQRPPRVFREHEQRPREHREHRQHRDHREQRGERNDNGGRPHNQQFNGNGRRNRRNPMRATMAISTMTPRRC